MSNRTIFNSYHKSLLDRAAAGSVGCAVRAHCLECMGGDKGEVERCTAPECPLFKYRSKAAIAVWKVPYAGPVSAKAAANRFQKKSG